MDKVKELNLKYNLSLKDKSKFDIKYNINHILIESNSFNSELLELKRNLVKKYNKKIKTINEQIKLLNKENISSSLKTLDLILIYKEDYASDLLSECNKQSIACKKKLYNSCKKIYKKIKQANQTKQTLNSIIKRLEKIC